MFCKKGVLRNFTKFTGKHLRQSLFFNKVAGFSPATLLKKRLAQVFSCEFFEISKNIFLQRTPLDDCFLISDICSNPIALHEIIIRSIDLIVLCDCIYDNSNIYIPPERHVSSLVGEG